MSYLDTTPDHYGKLSQKIIDLISEKHTAQYVFESQIKDNKGWSDTVGLIFYQAELTDPNHKHWFAIFQQQGKWMITSAEETVKEPISAIKSGDHYIYSHSRHDFRQGDICAIDGGRDYTRLVGDINVETAYFQATPQGMVKVNVQDNVITPAL